MSPSGAAQKGGVPRSRAGCATCKTKKLKCDERRPECLMCLKRGHPCPGYQRQLRWSRKHERHLEASSNSLPRNRHKQSQRHETSEAGTSTTTDSIHDPVAHAPTVPSIDDLLGHWPALIDSFGEKDSRGYVAKSENTARWRTGTEVPHTTMPSPPNSSLFGSAGGSDIVDLDGFSVPPEARSPEVNQSDNLIAGNCTIDNSRNDLNSSFVPHRGSLSQITDLPSFLITTWFNRICPMWSAFDSEINMNRKIALNTWPNNEAVFYSLQSMAASYMLDSLPHLAPTATLSARRAVQIIKRDLAHCTASQNIDQLPLGLVLSLICLGTSRCWSDSKQIGSAFLRQTKRLLRHLNCFSSKLPPQERQDLVFLNNSCFYWDMLCRAVSNDDEIGSSWQLYQDPVDWSAPLIPHPWTGVSATTQRFFVSVVSLCRRFHAREKRAHKVTGSSLRASLRDIEEATRLEQQIRLFKHPVESEGISTGDTCTPGFHLIAVAEAYRLAALLQLYATFDDLGSPEDIDSIGATETTHFGREISQRKHTRCLSSAFDLLRILQTIPSDSGARSIQPILYLTASIGLRFHEAALPVVDKCDPFEDQSAKEMLIHETPSSIISAPNGSPPECDLTLNDNLEIGTARHFILTRFDALERSLPSRPIQVAKDLVKEIWMSYDAFPNETHWLDVMQRTGLYTIFG